MSALMKNKRLLLASLLLAASTAAQAEIILQGAVVAHVQNKSMPGILFVSGTDLNQASYSALRASTLRNKRNVSEAHIFSAGIVGQATAASANQANARRHVARAQAYRTDYFK